MRSPLGSSVLVVLILGLISVSPATRAFYYVNPEEADSEAVIGSQQQAEDAKNVSFEVAPETSSSYEAESTPTVIKRDFGTPSPSGSRGLTNLPKQLISPGEPQQEGSKQSEQSPERESQSQEDAGKSRIVKLNEGIIDAPVNEPMGGANDRPEQGSQARGMTTFINGVTNAMKQGLQQPTFANQQQQQVVQQQQQQQQQAQIQQQSTSIQETPNQITTQNKSGDLPTIIESDRSQQATSQQSPPGSSPQQPQDTGLVSQTPANASLPNSSARTFDSWTNCVGAQSNKYGTCKNDVECNKYKGRPDGSCMGGFGVCCVMALTCGDKSLENNTFYANPDFPEPSWEARLCEVELKKKHKGIAQVMIEFEEFELAPPNQEGECITDVFQIKLASNRPSPYSLLRICGQNTGQHMYLDVSQVDEPLVLSVATSGGGFPRRWSIRIVQMDEKNHLLAPPGCLQYYTDTVGHFRSFNLGRNLKNLYYAICFRIDNGYSGIRFTENFFGMNGPACRSRKLGGHGRHNSSFEAHPHHLVIPPPGYGRPPPRPHHPVPLPPPSYQQGQQSQQFRPNYPIQQRFKRTLPHEHEKLIEKEEFKEQKEYKHEGYPPSHYPPPPPPSYGPGYGGQGGYGPPPPAYGGGYYSPKGEFEHKLRFDEKYPGKFHEHEHPHTKEGAVWSWKEKVGDTFGWGAKEELVHDKKYGEHHGYGPSHGYGHSGYGSHGYGQYHHKEIDKFGQKFEHLEYKHEKNHLGKEHEKTSSGWWPLWGNKEEKIDKKEKEKFFQHHEALFPMMHIPEMPHCEPRYCGQNDVITFPPSGDSISEMCGNRFNRGRGPKIISGSPLVVYVSNRGLHRGVGFDMNYEQVFYIPRPY